MVTKSKQLDPRTNTADYIREAAEWIMRAIKTQNQVECHDYLHNALRWLEKTGVAEIEPPSIQNIRF